MKVTNSSTIAIDPTIQVQIFSDLFLDQDLQKSFDHILKNSDLECILIAKETLEHTWEVQSCSMPNLVCLNGENNFLSSMQENIHASYANPDISERSEYSIQTVLENLLEHKDIEYLEYTKRIKYIHVIPTLGFSLIVGASAPFTPQHLAFLKWYSNLVTMYHANILVPHEHIQSLIKELTYADLLTSLITSIFSNLSEQGIRKVSLDTFSKVFSSSVLMLQKDKDIATDSDTNFKVITYIDNGIGITIDQKSIDLKESDMLSGVKAKGFYTSSNIESLPNISIKSPQRTFLYVATIGKKIEPYGLLCLIHKTSFEDIEMQTIKEFIRMLVIALDYNARVEHLYSSKQSIDQAYTQLQNTLKEKENLISLASHELRNPATIAKDAIALLDEYNAISDPFIKDKLAMISDAVEREFSIINSMLEVSRIDTKKLELIYQSIDIEELITTAVKEYTLEVHKKDLSISYVHTNSPLPHIQADSTRIREVLDNLVTNSIKYTNKGSILISSTLIHIQHTPFIQISVKDTGRGIPAEQQETLFQMFHRISSPNGASQTFQESHQGGLGLGLYIVKSIIDAHNGSIHVESAVDTGTTFTLTIPLSH